MRVGALEETITVSGAAPLVDTQNVRKQLVATRGPADRAADQHEADLHARHADARLYRRHRRRRPYLAEAGAYHGKRGTKVSFNGMGIENSSGNSSYQINAATVDEMVLQTSGISAEVNADGPVMNIVPKEGGNTFQTILSGLYSNHSMESDNLTDELNGARSDQTANKTRQDLRRGGQRRRPDQEGQAVVLRRRPHVGHGEAVRRRLLEQDAGSSS